MSRLTTSPCEEKAALIRYLNHRQLPIPFGFPLWRLLAIARMKITGILHKPGTHPWPGMKILIVVITVEPYLSEALMPNFNAENIGGIPMSQVWLAFTFKDKSYTITRKTPVEQSFCL